MQSDGTAAGTQAVGSITTPGLFSLIVGIEEVVPGFVAVRLATSVGRTAFVLDVQTGVVSQGPAAVGENQLNIGGSVSFDNRAFFVGPSVRSIDSTGTEIETAVFAVRGAAFVDGLVYLAVHTATLGTEPWPCASERSARTALRLAEQPRVRTIRQHTVRERGDREQRALPAPV